MTAAAAPAKRAKAGGSFVGNWGLLALTVAIFAMFAIILPNTFPTFDNLRAILTNQSIPALLALAATIPIVTGRSISPSATGSGWPTCWRCTCW